MVDVDVDSGRREAKRVSLTSRRLTFRSCISPSSPSFCISPFSFALSPRSSALHIVRQLHELRALRVAPQRLRAECRPVLLPRQNMCSSVLFAHGGSFERGWMSSTHEMRLGSWKLWWTIVLQYVACADMGDCAWGVVGGEAGVARARRGGAVCGRGPSRGGGRV